MYIRRVEIDNIKGIKRLEIQFDEPAGWHVLIGDNATGKTTIIKALSLLLVGENGARNFYSSWRPLLRRGKSQGTIYLYPTVIDDLKYWIDYYRQNDKKYFNAIKEKLPNAFQNAQFVLKTKIERKRLRIGKSRRITYSADFKNNGYNIFGENYEENQMLYFSVAYGALRRLSIEQTDISDNNDDTILDKINAHVTVFDERRGLADVVKWLKHLKLQKLEKNKNGIILDYLFKLLNESDLLPNGVQIHRVGSVGVIFKVYNSHRIDIDELSAGYKVIIATVLDIIHKMLDIFSPDYVFEEIKKGNLFINVPGVVLIDEIDIHLHPTWQAKIGEWFTKYFPRVQFIVTTHSPIICRAASKGSIWKLENENEKNQAREITGIEKKRLVYGNILEALGTEAFGRVASSEASELLKNEMTILFMKSIRGETSELEEERLTELQNILPTQKPILE